MRQVPLRSSLWCRLCTGKNMRPRVHTLLGQCLPPPLPILHFQAAFSGNAGEKILNPCEACQYRLHCVVLCLTPCVLQGQNDSYSEFRSDFIHLSISLTSATRTSSPHSYRHPSSLHLTPKAFTHFYSWWGLFENVLSLPIRQGNYYPRRALSPKFTRHLATIKYRIVVPQLFVMHGYTDESRESRLCLFRESQKLMSIFRQLGLIQ